MTTEVFKLIEAALAGDGQHVSLKLETDGEPLLIEVNALALRTILAELDAVVRRKPPTGMIEAIRPSQLFARPTDDRTDILLGFREPNSPEHIVALPPTAAAHLYRQLGEALKLCKSARH